MANRKLVAAIVLAVLAVGVAAIVMRPRKGPLGKRAGAIETVCAACGHVETRTLSSVPDTCSKCEEKQVYPAIKCPKCGGANPHAVMTGPQGRTPFVTCIQCGHQFIPRAPANDP